MPQAHGHSIVKDDGPKESEISAKTDSAMVEFIEAERHHKANPPDVAGVVLRIGKEIKVDAFEKSRLGGWTKQRLRDTTRLKRESRLSTRFGAWVE